MSNVLRKSQVWTADTVGVLSAKPVRIKFIQFYPKAAADAFELDFWDTQASITSSDQQVTATITSNTTFTATTAVLNGTQFPQYSILRLISSNGSSANTISLPNEGHWHIVTTGGTGNTVITSAGLTNEVAVVYHICAYQNYVGFAGISQATTMLDDYYFFGDKGLWLPNLYLKSLSSQAVLYIGMCPD